MTTITSSARYSAASSSIPARTFSGDPTIVRRPPGRPCDRNPLGLEELHGPLGRRDGDQLAAAQHRHRHPARGGQELGLLVGRRAQHPGRDRGALGLQRPDRLKALAVDAGDRRAGGVDEVGERVGEAELAGPDRALLRGAQQPRHRQLGQTRQRPGQVPEWVVGRQVVLEVGEQLGQLLREVVGRGLAAVALQRERRHRVGARRPAEPEVDPAGVQGRQDRERLGDLERAVVRQHHAAGADADRLGRRCDRADQYLG